MADDLKAKLLKILKEEKELYEELFQAAEGKKEALIDNDIDKLLEKVETDQKIIPEIEKKEAKRNEVIEEIKAEFNLQTAENSYKALFKKLPADWSEEFDPVRQELLALTDEFNKLNQNNQRLLEQALKLNQISFNTIIENLEDKTTYSDPAKKSAQPRIINKQG
jgi:flagellar biosynthesis/type III secretory pathway chaperone